MGEERDSLYLRVSGTRKTWAAIVAALTTLGGGGYAAIKQRETIDLLQQRVQSLEASHERDLSDAKEQTQFWRDRFCDLETELVGEISARVSLAAADAEPQRARRADTASSSQRAFDAAAAFWPCPANQQAMQERQRRAALRDLAAGALSTRPPGR